MAAWRLGVRSLGVLLLGVTLGAQAPLEFEVASIKRNTSAQFGSPLPRVGPGEVREVNVPVRNLILRAYPLQGLPIQVLGLPGWAEIEGERYDVVAKGKVDATPEERQQMWRALFAQRMKLAAHYETREQPGYDLVFARADHKLGPNIKPSTLDCSAPPALPALPQTDGSPEDTMKQFQQAAMRLCVPTVSWDTITALQEQLGLKLEGSTVQAQVLVVDHIERPTEN